MSKGQTLDVKRLLQKSTLKHKMYKLMNRTTVTLTLYELNLALMFVNFISLIC